VVPISRAGVLSAPSRYSTAEGFDHVLRVRQRQAVALELDLGAGGLVDHLEDADVHARLWTFTVRPERGRAKTRLVGSSSGD
jgi:hypothetical protein